MENLKYAIEAHRNEVYGEADPDFCWDIELYQSAGLLPADYEGPDEDKMKGSNYRLRKALRNVVSLARPHFTDEAQMLALHEAEAALAD